jgi:hypothetical protein
MMDGSVLPYAVNAHLVMQIIVGCNLSHGLFALAQIARFTADLRTHAECVRRGSPTAIMTTLRPLPRVPIITAFYVQINAAFPHAGRSSPGVADVALAPSLSAASRRRAWSHWLTPIPPPRSPAQTHAADLNTTRAAAARAARRMEHEVSLFAEFDLARMWRAALCVIWRTGIESARPGLLPPRRWWLLRGRCPRHRRRPVYFVGTLAFDDPSRLRRGNCAAVSAINYPAPGGNVAENRIHWSFDRLLTPTLALRMTALDPPLPTGKTSGLDTTNVGLKYETYHDNRHEALVSVGGLGIGQSGAPAVGADEPNTIQPGIFFGEDLATCPIGWPARLRRHRRGRGCILAGPTGKPSAPIQRSANSKPTSCRR